MTGKAPYTAHEIALWLKNWAATGDEDESEDLTNLKMQKLLYFAQGRYLAQYGTPLFSDRIEAWQHGPVVPDVYREMKYQPSKLAPSDDYDFGHLDKRTQSFLVGIWNSYGQYSACKLRDMTHQHGPWSRYFDPGKRGVEIPQAAIKEYFAGPEA